MRLQNLDVCGLNCNLTSSERFRGAGWSRGYTGRPRASAAGTPPLGNRGSAGGEAGQSRRAPRRRMGGPASAAADRLPYLPAVRALDHRVPSPPVDHFICTACGTQFAETTEPPDECPICTDPRQYVPPGGQQWTTLTQLTTGPPQRHPARARPHRHRHDAALRHRPARAARPARRQQHPLGLRHPPRRRDRGSRTRPRGPRRHRHLPPALLLGHGRVGAPLRLPDPPAQPGRRVDHAARRRDRRCGTARRSTSGTASR